MKRSRARTRALAIAGTLLVVGAAAAVPAGARPAPAPSVELQSAAGVAPDGISVGVQVVAACPERWTLVEAVVTVSQPQASGTASFPLTCIGSPRMFSVVVRAAIGTFELGTAQVTASVAAERGKTVRAQDSQEVLLQPTVTVALAETAQLESGGAALTIGVTVACPVETIGLGSSVNVSQQGLVSGNGSYVPVCDGQPHTFAVRVEAPQGAFRPGVAQALTFAVVDHDGVGIYGIDDGPVQLVG